jgi:hypothetical protein
MDGFSATELLEDISLYRPSYGNSQRQRGVCHDFPGFNKQRIANEFKKPKGSFELTVGLSAKGDFGIIERGLRSRFHALRISTRLSVSQNKNDCILHS